MAKPADQAMKALEETVTLLVEESVRQAVAEEREACARIAEETQSTLIAAKIRRRGSLWLSHLNLVEW